MGEGWTCVREGPETSGEGKGRSGGGPGRNGVSGLVMSDEVMGMRYEEPGPGRSAEEAEMDGGRLVWGCGHDCLVRQV